MPSRAPQQLEPDGCGPQPRPDQVRDGPSRANPVTGIQILTCGYLARHPALVAVLEGLGWNNPGGGMNPSTAPCGRGPGGAPEAVVAQTRSVAGRARGRWTHRARG